MVGATLELVFMGAIQIGAAVPPDVLVGAGLGTAFAIQSGQGADIALALALPIAILAQSLKVIVFIIRSWFMDLAMKLAEAGDIKKMHALNIGGLLLQCFMSVSYTHLDKTVKNRNEQNDKACDKEDTEMKNKITAISV